AGDSTGRWQLGRTRETRGIAGRRRSAGVNGRLRKASASESNRPVAGCHRKLSRMSAPDAKQLRISFSTLACPDWTWEEIAGAGGANGYGGVEIRMLKGQTDLLARPEFADDEIESNLGILERSGLQVCGLASSVRFDHLERDEREQEVGIGKLYIDLARR